MHVDVTFGDHGPVTLVVNGSAPQTSTVSTSCPGGHQKVLSMGILTCTDPAPGCAVHFDNVLVYTDP